jgi:hypothetical protein
VKGLPFQNPELIGRHFQETKLGWKEPTQYFQVAEEIILGTNKVPQHQVDWENSGVFPFILNICTEFSVSHSSYFRPRNIFSVQAYAKNYLGTVEERMVTKTPFEI